MFTLRFFHSSKLHPGKSAKMAFKHLSLTSSSASKYTVRVVRVHQAFAFITSVVRIEWQKLSSKQINFLFQPFHNECLSCATTAAAAAAATTVYNFDLIHFICLKIARVQA